MKGGNEVSMADEINPERRMLIKSEKHNKEIKTICGESRTTSEGREVPETGKMTRKS